MIYVNLFVWFLLVPDTSSIILTLTEIPLNTTVSASDIIVPITLIMI